MLFLIKGIIQHEALILALSSTFIIFCLLIFEFHKKVNKNFDKVLILPIGVLYVLMTHQIKYTGDSFKLNGFTFGYLICIFQQGFLRQLTRFRYILLFDVGALITRTVILYPGFLTDEMIVQLIVSVVVDILVLSSFYTQGREKRRMYDYFNEKLEEPDLNSVFSDSLPESNAVPSSTSSEEERLQGLRAENKQSSGNELEHSPSDINIIRDSLQSSKDLSARAHKPQKGEVKVIVSVSHEFKSTIYTIQSMIKIMRDHIRKQPIKDMYMEQSLNICKSNVDLLWHINHFFIDLQNLRKNQLRLRISSVSTKDLLEQLGSLFIFQCEHKCLDLTIKIEEDVPDYITTDKERLTQALVHLTNNAVKFTSKGGVTLGVQCDRDNQDDLIFSIIDTGVGMQQEEITNLFNMFGTLDVSRVGSKGAGLGLMIANELIVKLKATREKKVIKVETIHGRGSTFSFCLPLDYNKAKLNNIENDYAGEIGQEWGFNERRLAFMDR